MGFFNCDIKLHTNAYGKPLLIDESSYFNISHTEKLWVMAVNKMSPVGIDIERHKPRKNMQDMMRELFSRWMNMTRIFYETTYTRTKKPIFL